MNKHSRKNSENSRDSQYKFVNNKSQEALIPKDHRRYKTNLLNQHLEAHTFQPKVNKNSKTLAANKLMQLKEKQNLQVIKDSARERNTSNVKSSFLQDINHLECQPSADMTPNLSSKNTLNRISTNKITTLPEKKTIKKATANFAKQVIQQSKMYEKKVNTKQHQMAQIANENRK